MNKQRIADRASSATRCLERAWADLRKVIRGLPHAVMVLFDADSRKWKKGHFARETWSYRSNKKVHEVGISPDLFPSPESLLATLLHEAAHAWLFQKDPGHLRHFGGCGRGSANRYYHRKEFRDTCRALGLVCEFYNRRYGWTLTHWPDEGVPARYQFMLKLLSKSLPAGTGRPPLRAIKGTPPPGSGHTRLVCRCHPGNRSIYVNKFVLKDGGIVCAFCHAPFRPPKPS